MINELHKKITLIIIHFDILIIAIVSNSETNTPNIKKVKKQH